MDFNQISNSYDRTEQYDNNPASVDSGYVARYMTKVYGWMFAGLAVTALVALLVANTPALINIFFSSRLAVFGLMLVQIMLVGYLVLRIRKMSAATATAVFIGYSALTGITFSAILVTFSISSIFTVFAITAGTFGIMTVVGYVTKQDLTSFGRIMMMGLVGIILASIVNFFVGSSTLDWIISYVGVAVFVGLIAYDTQKIKAYALLDNEEDRKKGAIMGALALYLDFINLFLFLLRLFGDRRG